MNRNYKRPRGSIFESTLRSMKRANRLLNENFIFNGEDPYAQMAQSFPMGDGDTAEVMAYQGGEGGSGLNPDAQQHVDQIRQVALNGIQQFSQDVDSEEYDFFKKVWLMCDKLVSSKENNKDD